MNTPATEANEAKLIPFDPRLIDPSPYQPRRLYDPKKMAELEDSIREIGLIQPLVVRVSPVDPGRMELIVGERRLRSSIGAGLTVVPTLLRVVDDTIAERMVLEENLQRADLTVSEEGRAFARLLAMRDAAGNPVYTQSSLAEFIHKDSEYITARLRLVICPEELITAVDEGVIAVSVALLVGGIPDAKARQACAKEVLTPEIIDQQVPLNFAQTRELIREHFCVKLDAKRFDLDDPNLVPVATGEDGQRCHGGACSDCPFRSGNMEGVVLRKSETTGDGGKKKGTTSGAISNLCTLTKCHKLKLGAVWRDKKLRAEQAGLKTLDGAAAEKIFGGHNGELAHDCGLTELKQAKEVAKNHQVEWKNLNIPIIMARHPETLAVHELVDWKEAYPAICEAEKAKVKAEKSKPQSSKDAKYEADEKERKEKESLQTRLDKITVHEGLTHIVNHVTGKGMDLEFMNLMFQMALGSGGADGMYCVGKWLEIKMPKGTANSGRDYEDEILKILGERCQTQNAWLAHMAVALIARNVKWSGVRSEDLELLLTRCGGMKVKELQRRAEALLEGELKAKAAKDKPAKGKGSRNSTDKDNWTVEGEASTTAAADKLAKENAIVRKVADYNCDNCGVRIYAPPGTGAKLCVVPPGELHCKACCGTWDNTYFGFKRDGFNILKMGHNEHVEGVALGEWTIEDCIGHEPQKNTRAHKEWTAARSKIEVAAHKLVVKKQKAAAAATGAVESAQLPLGLSDGMISEVDAAVKRGKGAASRTPADAQENEELYQTYPEADAVLASPAPCDSGASVSELVTGIQDTKIGQPGRWTPADVEAGAKLLKAKTHKVADLIGPKPGKSDANVLRKWNAVRVQMIKKAGKLK